MFISTIDRLKEETPKSTVSKANLRGNGRGNVTDILSVTDIFSVSTGGGKYPPPVEKKSTAAAYVA